MGVHEDLNASKTGAYLPLTFALQVSVHSFRQCNMVYTNYVYQGSKFVSGLGASSPSTAPANTMASAGGQSDAAGYMGGLYAMPVAVKMSRMLSASGKLT